MTTDFNAKDTKYETQAFAPEHFGYGLLGSVAEAQLNKAQSKIAEKLAHPEKFDPRLSRDLADCLHGVNAVLYLLTRIKDHHETLMGHLPKMDPGSALSASAAEACIDFESLLYQAKAALDRLTYSIADREYKEAGCDSYSKFENILTQRKSDRRAAICLDAIKQCAPDLEGFLLDKKTGRSMRSHFIHRSSAMSSARAHFSIYHVKRGKFLIADHAFRNGTLFNTSSIITRDTVYILITSILAFLNTEPQIELRHCELKWAPKAIDISRFEDPRGEIVISSFSSDAAVIHVTNKNYRKQIEDHYILQAWKS
jgi:hypothetical protein